MACATAWIMNVAEMMWLLDGMFTLSGEVVYEHYIIGCHSCKAFTFILECTY